MELQKDLVLFGVNNRYFAVSIKNGQVVRLLKPIDNNTIIKLQNKSFFDENPLKINSHAKTITMSLNVINQCNLNCKYCFNKDKNLKRLSFEQCVEFIDKIIDKHNNANRFIVDLSGSGEPLLALDLIVRISKYCQSKSNEIKKEVLVMFATNGILLTKEVAKLLKDNLILFGISLDGKKNNNKYRVDYNGVNCYKRVIKNIKEIQNMDYVGVAVTLYDEKQNLVKICKEFIKYFETISIKPVRNNFEFGISKKNIDKIKYNYYKFTEFLIKESLYKYNTKYLKAILNGDDYFGRYLYRIILNQRISSRCDIGYSRYSLGIDGVIYGCPALVGRKNIKLNEGFSVERSMDCEKCYARYLCGGECMANSYNLNNNFNTNDEIMCELKKHLFQLGYYLVSMLKENKKIFLEILEFCNEKNNRDNINIEIQEKIEKENLSFIEAKINFDKT